MKIKYEIKLVDFFVFSDYLIKTSPLMLKTVRKGKMWWAISPLATGLILSILRGYSSEKTLTILAVLSVAISLPLFFMYTNYFKYRNKKQIKKFYESGSYSGIAGIHEMTISDDSLTDQTAEIDSKVLLESITKIETTPDHTFIFTDDITAHIIPHKGIIAGDVSQFIDKLNEAKRS